LSEVELTEEAFEREQEVKQWIEQAQRVAKKRKEPKIDVGQQCTEPYECAFIAYCQRNSVVAKFPIDLLPGSQNKQLREHIEKHEATDLRGIPDDCLNPKQLRVKHHTLKGTVYFDAKAVSKALGVHKLPALFLDFETINLTIPIWKGTNPYQQIPF